MKMGIFGSSKRRPLQTKTQVQPTDKIKSALSIPSAHLLYSRPPTLLCGRADNACTNLLGFLVRYVRTRGIVEIVESTTLSTSALPFAARTRHARLARLTRARRQWFGRRTARVLLADLWYFSSQKSTIKEKLLYDTYLSEFFSLVRKERKGQKEESIPLLTPSVASRRPVRTKCPDRPAIA